jgi:hypothetical protein
MSEVTPSEIGLGVRALREIEARLRVRFRAYLRPGERVSLSVEDEEGFVFARLVVASRDESFRLELEAAVIEQDQIAAVLGATTSKMRLFAAIEFVSGHAEEYFRSQRHVRHHLDWRIYDCEGVQVRFRGQRKHPDLESEATALLDEEGEPT